MFVTTLTLIYLALAIFVLVKYAAKKRQDLANWANSKGFNDFYLFRLVRSNRQPEEKKAEISKAMTEQIGQ